jgi:hypothetical protein
MREKDTANLVTLATQGVGRAGLCVVFLVAVIGLLAGCGGARTVGPDIAEHVARQVDNAPPPRVPSEFRPQFRRYPSGIADAAENPGAFGLSEDALRARAVLDSYFYKGDVYDQAVTLGVCTGADQLMEYMEELEAGTLEMKASDFEQFLEAYMINILKEAGYEVLHATVVGKAEGFVSTYLEHGDSIPPGVLKAYYQACVLRS